MSRLLSKRMHANHLYLLHSAKAITATDPAVRILDYGCGAGEVVVAGRRSGLNIVGADVFYAAASSKRDVEALGLLGTVITEIKNGHLEYDSETFDLVVTNQVIEHTADLDAVLTEISRVMKRNAKLLCIFPTKEVIREGHIGIPFIHWFAKDSPCRLKYALFCRTIGLGYFKHGKSRYEWTRDALNWVDKYTFYRHRQDIVNVFRKHFAVTMIESEYVRFRISHMLGMQHAGLVSRMVPSPLAPRLAQRILHRLTGMVLLAEKS